MHPRVRRLLADAELMRTEFAGHPHVQVEPIGWDPPEQYRVTYRVPGVTTDPTSGQPVVAEVHRAVITLPAAYPREKPYSTMETAVFHPNFGPNAGDEICIGDYWTPAQTLVDIVVKIGEMLQFQEYNVKSPLNALAARWCAENDSIFPIGSIVLFQAEPEISLTGDDDRIDVDDPATADEVTSADDAGAGESSDSKERDSTQSDPIEVSFD